MVNNYYKPGPATDKSKRSRIVEPWEPYGEFYLSGNFMEGDPAVTENNHKGVEGDDPEAAIVQEPVPVVEIPERPAEEAYELVLARAGASFRRDDVDQRIIREVKEGSATYGINNDGIIDSQEEVGGWPELKSAEAPADRDGDGMPDAWEEAQGLSPDDPEDATGYSLDTTYTNIEMYLNEIVDKEGRL